MTPLDKLTAYFEKFPGTGLRQAKRFAFHVLTLPNSEVKELAELITHLTDSVSECTSCHRFFSESGQKQPICRVCRDENRDHTKLLIVARDSDIDAIERSRVYDGYYFVLGGTVSLLASVEPEKVRGGALKAQVSQLIVKNNLQEIILAFAINPDGENTGRYVESVLKETLEGSAVAISHLGRGLSTGSELEYADPETIKSALSNRN